MRRASVDRNRLRNCLRSERRYTPVAQLVEQAAHNRPVVGSSPTGSTFKKEKIMSVFIGGVLLITAISLVAYGLYKSEVQSQVAEQKISATQEKFTNK